MSAWRPIKAEDSWEAPPSANTPAGIGDAAPDTKCPIPAKLAFILQQLSKHTREGKA